MSSYLINDSVAIDAGSLGFWRTPQDQEAVKHVFLTHAHTDHIASLPIFIENAWTPTGDCPTVYGGIETLEDVQKHIFNNRTWPDFIAISKTMPPFLRTVVLRPELPVQATGLTMTPVPVNHLVPTFGFVVSDGESAVIFGGDSGPTDRLWEIARKTPGVRAVFLEACFPNSMSRLAEVSRHLTPQMFAAEAAKLPPGTRFIAVHIKVRYRDQVIQELSELNMANLEIGECEEEYRF
ncbi:3',5'-cyclic-nucleotide phosphodiesterase [Occallatibacter riparius]|uniref:3',5'-cyclic-nucleotide phosphodiesterase n=1 Tax=Occallatibacter riparius TaxID=1002689 RepID=A0A9J7BQK9_9BACT|nr:3',5'-cyclic-nucleotide phosphodiesterase [Occallatibacter riparius]UWZ84871.1 3',5'-cyclic-nucleotide phosphodiesterase [Occallatibacter riparius]